MFFRCIAYTLLSCFCLGSALSAAPMGRKQTGVKGLLVVDLGNGEFAGKASQMNATVIQKPQEKQLMVQFNQDVGEMMQSATKEVVKFMNVRHDSIPEGNVIELAFADKYTPKDGPSAAVATALMVNSIITGEEIRNDFAVTGDMNSTGEVRPVGGVMSKVRGASKKCKIVAIPEQNVRAIHDAYIIEGEQYLASVQICSINHFDQAYAIAGGKDEKVEQALDSFEMVQKALKKNPKYIHNAKVKAKLKEVLEAMPHHVSADLLYKHSMKRGPKNLSLSGSMVAIDGASVDFMAMLRSKKFLESQGNKDVLFKFISEMRRLKPKLDKRTRDYADSFIDLAEYIKQVRSKKIWKPQNQRELQKYANAVDAERQVLIQDREVREELMID